MKNKMYEKFKINDSTSSIRVNPEYCIQEIVKKVDEELDKEEPL